MKALYNGTVMFPDTALTGKAVLFTDKVVGFCDETDIPAEAEKIDARGRYICPGLIDVHIHGFLGKDVSDGVPQDIIDIAEGIAKYGVTAFLPTTMTLGYDVLEKAFDAVRTARFMNQDGAEILGVNAEGPFINKAKKGAQSEDAVHLPDADFLLKYQDIIRLATIAPEVDGALDCIRRVRQESKIRVSMGHSAATYEQAAAGTEAGATHVTHLFNAMPPLHHREPGLTAQALGDDRLYTELICDTFHVHPALYNTVLRAKGEKLVLITDCLSAGGLPEGRYTLGGAEIIRKEKACFLTDGTIAGSVLTLNKGVYNLMRYTGCPAYTALRCASLSPAEAVGCAETKGSIATGKDADLWIADASMNAEAVFQRGRRMF